MATNYVNSATTSVWTASTAYALGARVSVDSGASSQYWARVYECTIAGTSGGTRPTWNSTVAATVTDNTVQWTCRTPTTWANASARLHYMIFAQTGQGVLTGGDDCYVKNTHSETFSGSVSFSPSGAYYGNTAPVRIFSTSSSAEPPTTYTAGATYKATGSFTIDGHFEFYGLTIGCGDGGGTGSINTTSGQAHTLTYKDCTIKILNALAASRMNLGFGSSSGTTARARYEGCTFTFGHASQRITPGREWQEFVDCSLDGAGTIPTVLIEFPVSSMSYSPAQVVFQGCDFSALGSGTLVDLVGYCGGAVFRNCKLHSGAVTTGTPPLPVSLIVDNCDSADTNYRMTRTSYAGTVLTETTRVKTGGASDGTTTIAWKLTTNATFNSRMSMQLRTPTITAWNETTGSALTLSVDILHDSATLLTDADIWLEVEYLGTAGTSKSSLSIGRLTPPATTTTNHPASTATWTTTGLVTPNKQTLSRTITPQEKGPILVWVHLAKASYTIYVDPLLSVA